MLHLTLKTKRAAAAGLLAASLCAATPAAAGPPYVTDDPVPTDIRRWEIYDFAAATNTAGVTSGAAGLDLNYGAAKDLQMTAVAPLGYERDRNATRVGLGDVELAAKYRFMHQRPGSITPDVAVFRACSYRQPPRGWDRIASACCCRFGPEKIWARGPSSAAFGYDINPGPASRDYWVSGLALSRALSDRLSLGAEVYHHTRDAVGAEAFTGMNLGVSYRLTTHVSLLAAGGRGLQNAAEEGGYEGYFAIKHDF